ncbi:MULTISPECIES: cell wall metabolism sensor histidine kinase WalK [unclassified Massilia]|uniref:sensor histidine kinase n=1 Tax=unclassified Massilia TaxID=2609279 RepID=UPI001B841642|nr:MULTISPECIES: ATP-binding protein [unclassified Massilia]MBQ5938440.1 HAMP domain-containing protein [Massilia sp. AB1]MBQ5963252.1 HAMP domain-containing protein [Massilia sp. ZL223]
MGRLFWKFFFSILLAQVAATIGIGGAFWLRDQARQHQAPVLDTGPPATIVLDAATATLRHGGIGALRGMLGELKRPQVFVLDAQRRDLLGRAVPAELIQEAERSLREGIPVRGVRQLLAPDGSRYLALVSRRFGPPPGGLRGPGMDPGWGRRVGQAAGIIAAVLASLLFAALLAWYFARPIRALRSAFDAAAAGDLAPRFVDKPTGGDELSDLGRDFDRMSGQLRMLMDGQRRLLHDVSHELRSPLARLQAAVGLAHQRPERIASSLERIERESVRMDKLVGELLTLSRLEASNGVARRESVDLAELVDAIVEDARFEAGEANPDDTPRIAVEAEGSVSVDGDPDLLWSALENVVRNAVKHGAAGGLVKVVVGATDGMARVEVLDRGPGIAPAELAHIFEPFYRANPSGTSVDGHGLGLAIAQRVVRAHGGDIAAANREGGGLQLRISLPRV